MKYPREEIEKIANSQKLLLWAILFNICFNVSVLVMRSALDEGPVNPSTVLAFAAYLWMGLLATIAFQITAVVRLCLALKEGWGTILYAIFQFIPCLNLILLVFLNGRATKRLQDCGIRVGLMGAKSKDVANYQPQGRNCPGCGEPVDATATSCPMCGKQLATT